MTIPSLIMILIIKINFNLMFPGVYKIAKLIWEILIIAGGESRKEKMQSGN